jgi:hypothetical protein
VSLDDSAVIQTVKRVRWVPVPSACRRRGFWGQPGRLRIGRPRDRCPVEGGWIRARRGWARCCQRSGGPPILVDESAEDVDPQVRADAGGCAHAFVDWLVSQRLSYSVGFTRPDDMAERLALIAVRVWQPVYDAVIGTRPPNAPGRARLPLVTRFLPAPHVGRVGAGPLRSAVSSYRS